MRNGFPSTRKVYLSPFFTSCGMGFACAKANETAPASNTASRIIFCSMKDLRSLLLGHLLNSDVAEHNQRILIVELKPDRPGLAALGVSRGFRNQFAIQFHADHIVTGFDIQSVPVELILFRVLGRRHIVETAGWVMVVIELDLNLVTHP